MGEHTKDIQSQKISFTADFNYFLYCQSSYTRQVVSKYARITKTSFTSSMPIYFQLVFITNTIILVPHKFKLQH